MRAVSVAVLAAAAQRTTRINLGTAIIILPVEDPLRVAEDAAVVDILSGGRLQLGLGTGGDPLTFAAFGQDPAARRERFAEGVRIIQDALAGRPGIRNLRSALLKADSRSESAGETLTRERLSRLKLPMPEPQVEVQTRLGRHRLDFAWKEQKLAL